MTQRKGLYAQQHSGSRAGKAGLCAILVSTALIAPTWAQGTLAAGAAQDRVPLTMPQDAFATVNGVALPQRQLERTLRENGQAPTPASMQTVRQGLLARELLRQAAESDGLGDTPQVREAMEKARVDTENRLYIQLYLHPQPVTEAQIQARYASVSASLAPEEYRARVITVPDDATAQAVLAKLRDGVPFDTLAAQQAPGIGETTLPWVSLGTPPVEGRTWGLPLPLAQAIVALSEGEVTRTPVVVGNTRMIVRLDAKRKTVVPSYESAKPALRRALEEAAREQAFTQLVTELGHAAVIVQRNGPDLMASAPRKPEPPAAPDERAGQTGKERP